MNRYPELEPTIDCAARISAKREHLRYEHSLGMHRDAPKPRCPACPEAPAKSREGQR